MKKRMISLLLCLSLLVSSLPARALAAGTGEDVPAAGEEAEAPAAAEDVPAAAEEAELPAGAAQEASNTLGELGGYLAGNALNTASLYADRKFTWPNGFGFAAENGNNFADRLRGVSASVVGGNNAANGPDRRILNRNGTITWIQTKYHSTASDSVSAAFDDAGNYRYVIDGHAMQLEVPADQYEDAVAALRKKIANGQMANCGVTDPDEAAEIIRKGNLSYEQAKNIAKAGNLDSLTYDAAHGFVHASCAAGISFAIDFACCRMNGLETADALKSAGLNGIKTGGAIFATYVISSQLAKTGLADSLKSALIPTAEAITKTFGDDVCRAIMQRAGVQAAGAVTPVQVANALSRELIADGVLVVVLTGMDVADLFQGRISQEEVLKNLTVTIVSIAAGTAGGYGGAALGSFVAPGVGTTVGAILGSVATGALSAWAAEALIAPYYESDAEEMFAIISDQFTILCSDYVISEEEAERIVDALDGALVGDVLKDMYASEDREQFARALLEPLFIAEAEQRPTIVTPSEEELRYSMREELNGIVFIH